MKRITLAVCAALTLAMLATAATRTTQTMTQAETYKIVVLSDIHLLAPSLHDDSKAAWQLAAADLKLALASDTIMLRTTDWIIGQRPQLVLITGDLTHNGARASHDRLCAHLSRLKQAGIGVLVIPGNHDINSPNARRYLGDKAVPTATITREEFAQIYEPFGYGDNARRDPASLSYACEPLPGLVVLGIDSNRDQENRLVARGDSADVYHNAGRVNPLTLQWLQQQARDARRQGKRVIAMMHHHLLEHIDGEARFLPNYIVDGHEQVAQVLEQCGVHAVFTGHLHITDAVTDGAVTDIATGSATMWPMPVRVGTIDLAHDSLRIDTQFAPMIDDERLLDAARTQVEQGVPTVAQAIATRLWPRVKAKMDGLVAFFGSQGVTLPSLPADPAQATRLLTAHMSEPLTQSLLSVTRGGEDPAQASAIVDAVKQGVRGVATDLFPAEMADEVGVLLLDNAMPRLEPMMRSALEDRNRVDTPQESRTPDHRLSVAL